MEWYNEAHPSSRFFFSEGGGKLFGDLKCFITEVYRLQRLFERWSVAIRSGTRKAEGKLSDQVWTKLMKELLQLKLQKALTPLYRSAEAPPHNVQKKSWC